jgi:hypothetical protein
MYKKINFSWLVLLVGFALNAQEQKTALETRNEINCHLTKVDFVKLKKVSLFKEYKTEELSFAVFSQKQSKNYTSNLAFYVKSSQSTLSYKENEGLINSGIARFVKIEFAGKKVKGFKDFNSRTIV